MVIFSEGAPNSNPPQASPAPIWAIHHHQGCRGQCLWAQYSTIPWSAPSVQCGLPSALLSTSTGHIRRGKTTHTNIVKPWLHGTSHNWSDYGHTDLEHLPAEDPAILSCQSRPTPSPAKVAYQGPSSAEVSSSHGGTQRNGDHWFLRGEEWSRRILVATHLFLLDPHHCFFQFSSFLNCSTIYYFCSFRVLKFQSHFEALNDVFLALNGWENMNPFQTQY